jgi:hypothetical protein
MTDAIGAALAARIGRPVCDWLYGARGGDAPCAGLAAQGVLVSHAAGVCREAALRETARLVLMQDDLLHVAAVLDAHDIAFLPIKGLALSQILYGDATRRGCTDIDLLLRASDRAAAAAALAAAGFSRHATAYTDGHVEELHAPRHGASVELHFSLSVGERLSRLHAVLWESPATIEIAGHRLQVPSSERYLLLLLAHLARHADTPRLLWFEDVRQFVARHPRLDFALLLSLARRARAGTAAWAGARLTRSFFAEVGLPPPIPVDVEDALARARSLPARLAMPRLLARMVRTPDGVSQRAYSFALSEHWKDRIDLVWSFARRRLGS